MAGQEHRLASDFPRVLWSLADPAFFSVLLAQVHEKLDSVLGSLEPALQVDLVWALCVLQQVQVAELQTVLHPGLHTRFLGETALLHTAWACTPMEHGGLLLYQPGKTLEQRQRAEHTKHSLVICDFFFSDHSLQLAYKLNCGTPA